MNHTTQALKLLSQKRSVNLPLTPVVRGVGQHYAQLKILGLEENRITSNETQEQLLSDKTASFTQNCKISGFRRHSGINTDFNEATDFVPQKS